jgi:hypothetical protein
MPLLFVDAIQLVHLHDFPNEEGTKKRLTRIFYEDVFLPFEIGGIKFIMNVKSNYCVITAAVSEEEKKLFIARAHEFGVSANAIIRRLVQYFLDEKISWTDLSRLYAELPIISDCNNSRRTQVRATLASEQYFVFSRKAETWGSTPTVTIKRLILLYLSGKIERQEIWY